MAAAPSNQESSDDISARREERKLIAYIRAGDVAAFERLVKMYSEDMVRYAAKGTGSWDVAQDIVQNIFVSIWTRHTVWEVNISLSSYLYRSVTHAIVKHSRSQKAANSLDDANIAADRASDVLINESDISATAARVLQSLPHQTRAVFTLTRGHHLSYSDTARELGVSVKTVEKHMSRALAALRRALGDWL